MNRLKSYVRRTLLTAAREYSYPAKRRTVEGTRIACRDAMNGTDTGWWTDLIYTSGMLLMARKYRQGIAEALEAYADDVGEEFTYRHSTYDGVAVPASRILRALYRPKAYTWEDWREGTEGVGNEAALIGLRFAVEWYAAEVARELGVEV